MYHSSIIITITIIIIIIIIIILLYLETSRYSRMICYKYGRSYPRGL